MRFKRYLSNSTMPNINFVILYVDSPTQSAQFYSQLLGLDPVESSPTFVLFRLETGMMFGLWSRHTVEPAATAVGGSELAFAVANDAAVQRLHGEWSQRGITVVQGPLHMDFGYTFTAIDPDGHRLRVFCPAAV